MNSELLLWHIAFLSSGLYVRDGIPSCLRLSIVDCACFGISYVQIRLACREQVRRPGKDQIQF